MYDILLWYVFVSVFVNVNLSAQADDDVSCFGRADRQLVNQRLGTKTPYRFLRPFDEGNDFGKSVSEPYEGIYICIYIIILGKVLNWVHKIYVFKSFNQPTIFKQKEKFIK